MTARGGGRAALRPRVAVLDYGMGNLRSVARALEHEGAEAVVLERPAPEAEWDALVLPGVGALGDCMEGLCQSGLATWIRTWVTEEQRPFLGVCLGLQALFDHSEEGGVDGLGLLRGRVRHFPRDRGLKIPHMGWNSVRFTHPEDPLAARLEDGDQFYFDHSYYAEPEDPEVVWAWTDYGLPFASAVRAGPVLATQFHPEKSQELGLQIYRNFLHPLAPTPNPHD